jgi:S-DNA-T family DNA segregation ATPase FtsK/SpoIIIE
MLLTLFSRLINIIDNDFIELGGLVGFQTFKELSLWLGEIGATITILVGLLLSGIWTFPNFVNKLVSKKRNSDLDVNLKKENYPIFQKPDDFEVDDSPEESVLNPEPELTENKEVAITNQTESKVAFEIITEADKNNQEIIEDDEPLEVAKTNSTSLYSYPKIDILSDYSNNNRKLDPREIEQSKDMIVNALESFKIKIDKISATIGPTVTLYEIVPASGIRISKIRTLEDDIAMNLAALKVRIIAPMPGKGTIGIEVPNTNREIVGLRDALLSPAYQNSKAVIPLILGKNVLNEVIVQDLTKMPHLLIN